MSSAWDAGPLGKLVWATRRAEWDKVDAESLYEAVAQLRTPETSARYRAMWDARRAADEAWTVLMNAADAADDAAVGVAACGMGCCRMRDDR